MAAGDTDMPLSDMDRFVVYRVRFQVVNGGKAAAIMVPTLQWSYGPTASLWTQVPAVDPVEGDPFYAASDYGRTFLVRTDDISPSAFKLATSFDSTAKPIVGAASAGYNPIGVLALPAHSFTEIEFAVRATTSASWTAPYLFGLDLGVTLKDTTSAAVTMRSEPVFPLPYGATSGTPVNENLPSSPGSTSGGANPVAYPLTTPTTGAPQTASSGPTITAMLASARRTASGAAYPLTQSFTTPHTNYTLTEDACGACHRAHAAPASSLRVNASVSALCLACHNGTGSNYTVSTQWSNPSLPANDASTSSYYSHPATDDNSNHMSDLINEFGGVLNRHSQCTDCHQPHNAAAPRPVATVNGWTASGDLAGASSVRVVNGAAKQPPTYSWTTGTSLEYQLCFKCHSGFTKLLAQDAAHPSRWALDKGVELNPANVSYHPIEAAGRNQNSWMRYSLLDPAFGKLWQFQTTDVVRCENCHGLNTGTGTTPSVLLDNHASTNRGILLRNYQDRVLMTATQAYSSSNFALCYLCHAEAPMTNTGGSFLRSSNFEFHGRHVSGLRNIGTGGTDIDTPGAGQGNATCSECHFRTHSTALAVGGQAANGGLVNFSPNVQGLKNGVADPSTPPTFLQATATTYGNCTLVCHGKVHNALQY